ncbi:sensor histidine kinase [Photobacterium gaetbulicola]|uniref:histidine kinase n=1 Tax=Photobacterium gaetbulicola Gung47 TaxID=658445 RepID=A0A0C5WWJ7_9GAMM|nr:sensor histidine kinase [Photobacterium gaetbulicola]AJR09399.1 putative sensor kinase citA [Photobacterium gaetbulicola Gung47]PSU14201.1 sensor histidine kinase [Photobacterium gaetbulicola]
MSFNKQIMICLLLVLAAQALVWWWLVTPKAMVVLRQEVAARAMVQSRQIAELRLLQRSVEAGDTEAVGELVDDLYAHSDADFIVIGDKHGIRMAHPIADRIGLPIMGGDIDAALTSGAHYLSEGVGSLGRSLRYITPIKNTHGEIIGMIKVGYLIDTLSHWKRLYWAPIWIAVITTIAFSAILTWLISQWIRRGMQGMEPQELLQMLDLKRGILNATHEGIIALDHQNHILECNHNARRWLGLKDTALLGQPVGRIFSSEGFCDAHRGSVADQMAQFNGHAVIASRVSLAATNGGCVISFRRRDEMSLLTEQLSQIRQHTESLRIMRHEYANKLTTIGGLLQLGKSDTALRLINTHSAGQQQLIDRITQVCRLDMMAGLLIGKCHRAMELQLNFRLSDDSSITCLPPQLSEETLCAIVGNLIDNSFAACSMGNGEIELAIIDEGPELMITICDNGCGIEPALIDRIFELGVTSKQADGHGIGLHLVKTHVEEAQGYIDLDSEPGATTFALYIPFPQPTEHKDVP